MVRDRFLTAGMQSSEGPNTPERGRAVVETELKRFKDVAARTGIRIAG